jgi:hypothetical protein
VIFIPLPYTSGSAVRLQWTAHELVQHSGHLITRFLPRVCRVSDAVSQRTGLASQYSQIQCLVAIKAEREIDVNRLRDSPLYIHGHKVKSPQNYGKKSFGISCFPSQYLDCSAPCHQPPHLEFRRYRFPFSADHHQGPPCLAMSYSPKPITGCTKAIRTGFRDLGRWEIPPCNKLNTSTGIRLIDVLRYCPQVETIIKPPYNIYEDPHVSGKAVCSMVSSTSTRLSAQSSLG